MSVYRVGGLRAGTGDGLCTRADHARGPRRPPPRAHALRAGTRPPVLNDHLDQLGDARRAGTVRPRPAPLSGSPRAPTAPRPGCAHARVRGSPARGAASRQNKHPLPPPTAGPSGMTSFMKQTPLRGWPSHSLGLLLPPGVTLVRGMNTPNPCPPVQDRRPGVRPEGSVTQGRARGPQACSP